MSSWIFFVVCFSFYKIFIHQHIADEIGLVSLTDGHYLVKNDGGGIFSFGNVSLDFPLILLHDPVYFANKLLGHFGNVKQNKAKLLVVELAVTVAGCQQSSIQENGCGHTFK